MSLDEREGSEGSLCLFERSHGCLLMDARGHRGACLLTDAKGHQCLFTDARGRNSSHGCLLTDARGHKGLLTDARGYGCLLTDARRHRRPFAYAKGHRDASSLTRGGERQDGSALELFGTLLSCLIALAFVSAVR
eukprot:1972342-Rhodomonas_salina.2